MPEKRPTKGSNRPRLCAIGLETAQTRDRGGGGGWATWLKSHSECTESIRDPHFLLFFTRSESDNQTLRPPVGALLALAPKRILAQSVKNYPGWCC